MDHYDKDRREILLNLAVVAAVALSLLLINMIVAFVVGIAAAVLLLSLLAAVLLALQIHRELRPVRQLAADVEAAVRAARKAQGPWAKAGGPARARVLYALARLVQKHARLFAVLDRVDIGVVVTEAGSWGAFEDGLVAELAVRSVPAIVAITALLLPLASPTWRTRQYSSSLAIAGVIALPWLTIWPYLLFQHSPLLFTEWLWANNLEHYKGNAQQATFYLRMLPWFAWPALPLALWSLWRNHTRRKPLLPA